MKTKLFALLLVAAGTVCAQLSVGISIGAPPRPRVVRVEPRSPGAGYFFVKGYWYPVGNHYKWHEGYWTRPAFAGAQWVEPHYSDHRFYEGYWAGDRGQVPHDHRWDKAKDRNRDYDRDHRK